MSDGTTLIQSALKLIGAHSIYAPADAESIEVSLGTLNSMLQLWLSQGIEIVNANLSYIAIKALYQVYTVPDKVVSSTLPRGAGNNRGRSSRVYSGTGATIASSDA